MYVLQHKVNKKFFKRFTSLKGLYLTTISLHKARRFNADGLADFQMYYPYADNWDFIISS